MLSFILLAEFVPCKKNQDYFWIMISRNLPSYFVNVDFLDQAMANKSFRGADFSAIEKVTAFYKQCGASKNIELLFLLSSGELSKMPHDRKSSFFFKNSYNIISTLFLVLFHGSFPAENYCFGDQFMVDRQHPKMTGQVECG